MPGGAGGGGGSRMANPAALRRARALSRQGAGARLKGGRLPRTPRRVGWRVQRAHGRRVRRRRGRRRPGRPCARGSKSIGSVNNLLADGLSAQDPRNREVGQSKRRRSAARKRGGKDGRPRRPMASSTRAAPRNKEAARRPRRTPPWSSADKPKLDEETGDSDAKVDAPAVGGGGPTPLKLSKGKQKPTLVDLERVVAAFEKLAVQQRDSDKRARAARLLRTSSAARGRPGRPGSHRARRRPTKPSETGAPRPTSSWPTRARWSPEGRAGLHFTP